MLSAIFKEVWRGHGIYWHGKHGYGDETIPHTRTIGEYRAKIDAKLAAEDAARPAHERYWDSLSSDERRKWRRACQTTELSASELAYTNAGETPIGSLWQTDCGNQWRVIEQARPEYVKVKREPQGDTSVWHTSSLTGTTAKRIA